MCFWPLDPTKIVFVRYPYLDPTGVAYYATSGPLVGCEGDSLCGGTAVGRWTCDCQVAGSIPGRSAFT